MKKINFANSILIAALLSSCASDSSLEGYVVKVDDKDDWGVVNADGDIIVEDFFDEEPSTPYDGMVYVKEQNDNESYYEFYELSEKPEQVGDRYKYVLSFSEGLAAVVKKNKPISYMKKDGSVAFTCETSIEEAASFMSGFAPVCNLDNEWGFIDVNGEIVIAFDYTSVGFFHEDLARVSWMDSTDGQQFGFIDKSGDKVMDFGNDYDIVGHFNEGLCRVKENDGGFGYLNRDGEEAIKCDKDYRFASNFINGMAAVKNEDGEYSVINYEGEEIVKADKDLKLMFEFKSFAMNLILESDDGNLELKDLEGNDLAEVEDIKGIYLLGAKSMFVSDDGDWYLLNYDGTRVDEEVEFERVADPTRDNHEERFFPYEDDYSLNTIQSDFFDVAGAISKIDIKSHMPGAGNAGTVLANNPVDLSRYTYRDYCGIPEVQCTQDISLDHKMHFTEYIAIEEVDTIINNGYTSTRGNGNYSFNEESTYSYSVLSLSLGYSKAYTKGQSIAEVLAEEVASVHSASVQPGSENSENDGEYIIAKDDDEKPYANVSYRSGSITIETR